MTVTMTMNYEVLREKQDACPLLNLDVQGAWVQPKKRLISQPNPCYEV